MELGNYSLSVTCGYFLFMIGCSRFSHYTLIVRWLTADLWWGPLVTRFFFHCKWLSNVLSLLGVKWRFLWWFSPSCERVFFFSFSKVVQCNFCLPVCVATVSGSAQWHYFDVIWSRKARQVARVYQSSRNASRSERTSFATSLRKSSLCSRAITAASLRRKNVNPLNDNTFGIPLETIFVIIFLNIYMSNILRWRD